MACAVSFLTVAWRMSVKQKLGFLSLQECSWHLISLFEIVAAFHVLGFSFPEHEAPGSRILFITQVFSLYLSLY